MRASPLLLKRVKLKVSSSDLAEKLDACIALSKSEHLSPAFQEALMMLFRVIKVILDICMTNSENSSLPPSADPHRDKQPKKPARKMPHPKRRPGAQMGHEGYHLEQTTPTRIVKLEVDRSKIPDDRQLTSVDPVKRQVFDITFSVDVVEYQAEVLIDQFGNRYVAEFPSGVSAYAQYGPGLKAYVVDLLENQFVPFERLSEHIKQHFGIPISTGAIRNFRKEAADHLKGWFKDWVKTKLTEEADVVYTDMTNINISGKQQHASIYCNDKYTYLVPHEHKGHEPVKDIGILPNKRKDQVAMHDCDPTFFQYDNLQHAACGAHVIRDLHAVVEKEGLKWPKNMEKMLNEANAEKRLPKEERNTLTYYTRRYKAVLTRGRKETDALKAKQMLPDGKPLKSPLASDVLLDRMTKYTDAYLKFIERDDVDFTNNIAERGQRPLKLHDKISGCHKSLESAEETLLIRSYTDTFENAGLSPQESLRLIFSDKIPEGVNLNDSHPELFQKIEESSAPL